MSEYLSEAQKTYLLELARNVITSRLASGKSAKPMTEDPVLRTDRGAFVTLKVNGELRGCIGYPLPYKPLADAVAEMAVAAATQDTRFEPIGAEELPRLEIEISVLTLPLPISDVSEIIVGKHGIIVSKGRYSGLLLPQVPLEYGWDLSTYLTHGCRKAGLPGDEWKKGALIKVFEAQIFSKSEARGAKA